MRRDDSRRSKSRSRSPPRQSRDASLTQRHRPSAPPSKSSEATSISKQLSEEERNLRIAEMLEAGASRVAEARARVNELNELASQEEAAFKARQGEKDGVAAPKFIQDINREIYNSGKETLEARLAKMRAFQEKDRDEVL